jgi:hypothetical protein
MEALALQQQPLAAFAMAKAANHLKDSIMKSKKLELSLFRRAISTAIALCAAVTVPALMAQTTNYAKVDGVGSLIDPAAGGGCFGIGGFGCYRDDAYMHGDSVNRSSVLFQVLRDPANCNSVVLTGLPTTGAAILAKSWNERYPSDRGHVNSRTYTTSSTTATIPVTASTDWTTLAVVSNSPLNNGTRQLVRATCISSNVTSNVSLTNNQALVDIAAEYGTWTGNGSLITASFNNRVSDTQQGYGRYQDLVGLYGDGTYSVQHFQIYNNGSCNSVRISSSSGAAAYIIRSKEWSSASWTTRVSAGFTPTPLTLSVNPTGSVGGYYLFQVQTLDNSSRGTVSVTCV